MNHLKTVGLNWLALICLTALLGCSDDDTEPESCAEHEECLDSSICVSNRCEGAYGRNYDIVITNALYIPDADPDGEFWDPMGGFPDPYAILYDTDSNLCTTSSQEDERSPTWNHRCPETFFIEESTRFGWSVYENDDADDPLIAGIPEGEEFQITVEDIRSGSFGGSYDGVTVAFRIEPH